MESTTIYQRQVAVKTVLRQIIESALIQPANESIYLLTPQEQKIYRVNIVGTILNKEIIGAITNVLLDDGTGQIILRTFEEDTPLKNMIIGDTIRVIAKPRSYNQEKYLSPEIIKKIDYLWLKIRKLELQLPSSNLSGKMLISEEVAKGEETKDLPRLKILQTIKELDQGSGVVIEELIEKVPFQQGEIIIEKMLESGEIYQISPGRVKVL